MLRLVSSDPVKSILCSVAILIIPPSTDGSFNIHVLPIERAATVAV